MFPRMSLHLILCQIYGSSNFLLRLHSTQDMINIRHRRYFLFIPRILNHLHYLGWHNRRAWIVLFRFQSAFQASIQIDSRSRSSSCALGFCSQSGWTFRAIKRPGQTCLQRQEKHLRSVSVLVRWNVFVCISCCVKAHWPSCVLFVCRDVFEVYWVPPKVGLGRVYVCAYACVGVLLRECRV